MLINQLKQASIYFMSVFYIYIGIKHFLDLEYFLKIMPKYIPFHKEMVVVSGVFEVFLGLLLLIPKFRKPVSVGLILLLIAVFPANIYLYTTDEPIMGISKNDALIRMFFQVPLIVIAYWHGLKNSSKLFSYLCLFFFLLIILYFVVLI